MAHDPRLVSDDKIEELRPRIPDWVKRLERPATPCITPTFGPLEGIRVVGTGCLVAQPYIGTKLAEFGAEVIHVERPGGDVFRFTAPQLTRGPRPHGCDEAEVTKNKLSMGLDLKYARGIELLMALGRFRTFRWNPRRPGPASAMESPTNWRWRSTRASSSCGSAPMGNTAKRTISAARATTRSR